MIDFTGNPHSPPTNRPTPDAKKVASLASITYLVSGTAALSGSAEAPASENLLELGDQIALLSAQIQAATYQLLVMIRDFDEREGWFCGVGKNDFRSCAHWLNWRTGLDLGAAREKVRVARALGELPNISESMRRGELSYSKVRALTRVATPENEEELLGFAKNGTASHVEKLVRAWRRVDRYAELELENQRRASRYLSTYTDEDGMVVLRARLEPEVGVAVVRALEAAEQMLFGKDRSREATQEAGQDDNQVNEESVSQRRADAIGLVAESALSHGLDKNPRADRLQVVIHVDEQVLQRPEEPGVSMLDDGQNVSAETSRRLACDATKVIMRHDSEGRTLDVGRKTRTISIALRRALAHRDKTCQFPGCDLKYCDAHHVEHWAEGGETKLDNLVLLCRRHHRAVHEGGYRLERFPDQESYRVLRPNGTEIVAAPPTSAEAGISSSGTMSAHAMSTSSNEELEGRLIRDGVLIDPKTGYPGWDGGTWDLQMAVQSYREIGRT